MHSSLYCVVRKQRKLCSGTEWDRLDDLPHFAPLQETIGFHVLDNRVVRKQRKLCSGTEWDRLDDLPHFAPLQKTKGLHILNVFGRPRDSRGVHLDFF